LNRSFLFVVVGAKKHYVARETRFLVRYPRGPGGYAMQRVFIGLFASLLMACPATRSTKETKKVTATPTSTPAKEKEEEIGLLTVRAALLSEQVACVYGGWTCLSGEQTPLLSCTTDGGKTFSAVTPAETCAFIKDHQVSRDGSAIWFSCEGKDGAPYFVRSLNKGQSFDHSEPLSARGELLAWSFSSSKNGIAIIAAEGEEAAQNIAYLEKSTTDAGKTWEPLFSITNEKAASFSPEQEIGRRPPQPVVPSFVLQNRIGPDGGPAYELEESGGKALLSLAWKDNPGKCSPAASLPTEDLLPGMNPIQWAPVPK
jgi:hypothetical protein